MKTSVTADFTQKNEFWRQLVTSRRYATPARDRKLLVERLPALATLRYHLGTNWQILLGAISVLRNTFDRPRWAEVCYNMLRVAERCGGRFHIDGLENVAGSDEPLVIISNHMSTLETYILAAIVLPFCDMAFILKRELLTYPVFGTLLRGTEPIPVTRKDARTDLNIVMTKGKEYLESGRSVVVFPQSTRSDLFNPGAFNTLGIKLAARCGTEIVPLAVKTDFLANGKILKAIGSVHPERSVHLQFGKRLRVDGKGREEHGAVIEFISKQLREWGARTAGRPANGE